jgi:cytochrome P450
VPTSGDVASDSARDAAAIFDPRTYIEDVPFAARARPRRQHGVVWVDEPAVLSWPASPGFWLVLQHADVQAVLRNARGYSSWLGGTQIRDPATPADLDFVLRMMLNMDPPEHTRLRGLLGRAFTPRAVARLEDRIFATTHHLVERALGHLRRCWRQRNGPRGAEAATRARTGRPTARPAHPGGDGRPLRLRAPAG